MVLLSLMEASGLLLTVLPPLVVVPLMVITFYLRSLREHQVTWHADLIRRVESLDASVMDLRKMLCDFERDYTSKEEWLRECMHTRHVLEQLTETTIRIETTLRNTTPSAVPEPRPCVGNVGQMSSAAYRQEAQCHQEGGV